MVSGSEVGTRVWSWHPGLKLAPKVGVKFRVQLMKCKQSWYDKTLGLKNG
jgi:hypothetical protein